MENQGKYIVPGLLYGINVLSEIVDSSEGLSLKELSSKMNIPKTTLFRILHTLEKEGLIEKNNDRFECSFKLVKMGMSALSKMDVRNIATPVLYDLSHTIHETSHLAVMSGKSSLIIEVCDSPDPVNISSRAGTSVSLHCSATGKVLLSWGIGPDNLDDFYNGTTLNRYTDNTIVTISGLKKECLKIIDQGYAVDEEEYHEGIRCLAAPIYNAYGKIAAAVGITAATFRFSPDKIEKYSASVREAASMISQKLGA